MSTTKDKSLCVSYCIAPLSSSIGGLTVTGILTFVFEFHCYSSYHQMHHKGKTVGMDMHVEHSTITKNMRVKEIMSVVQLGVVIFSKQGIKICKQLLYMSVLFQSSCLKSTGVTFTFRLRIEMSWCLILNNHHF